MALRRVLLLFLALVLSTHAFYFPGLAPTNFCLEQVKKHDKNSRCLVNVFVHVNKLDSVKTVIPYEYSRFDFCSPNINTRDRDPLENLGQVVFGERLRASPYDVRFAENVTAGRELCTKTYRMDNKDDMAKLEFLRERIHEGYMHQWVIDNMPVTWCYSIMESDRPYCTTRFPVGCFVTPEGVKHDACYLSNLLNDKGATYVFNHVHLVISYHKGRAQNNFTDGRIVRAQIQLASCKEFPCTVKSEPLKLPKPKDIARQFKLTYSYSVEFIEMENIRWASRWDYILYHDSSHSNVQWFSVMNSVLIIVFLSAMLGMILWRLLQGNITQYSQANASKGTWKDFGWKWTLVHDDVFRPPRAPMLLSVCVGSGAQILFMTLAVLNFSCLGILCPPNRGSFMTAILVFYAVFGWVAGFISARLYKMFGGLRWEIIALMTAFFVPGVVFSLQVILNLLQWGTGSSAAIPVTTLMSLLCLWFGISLPLTLFGSFLGFRKTRPEPPVKSNEIPREIPKRSCLAHLVPSSLIGGVLPFGCIFIQLYFILNSLWSDQVYYYMPGFVMLAFLALVVVCAEISVLLCYFHLCSEDYRWWWRSFFSTGTVAFYFFLFSVHYLFHKTSITGGRSYLLYFGYTLIMVFLFFIMTGTIGFLASLLFVHKIYSKAILTKSLVTSNSDQDQLVVLPVQKCKMAVFKIQGAW